MSTENEQAQQQRMQFDDFYQLPIFYPQEQLESYCILFGAFEPHMCDDILALGELMSWKQGQVGNGIENKKVRDSEIAWINRRNDDQPGVELRNHIIDRIGHTIARVNVEKFGDMDLVGHRSVQYTKYGLDQHYDWHVDVDEGQAAAHHRKLSVVVMLTDENDYEGGELLLNLGGNAETPLALRPPKGAAVLFYSHIPHKVTPVTKGNRATLVTWALGPRMR